MSTDAILARGETLTRPPRPTHASSLSAVW